MKFYIFLLSFVLFTSFFVLSSYADDRLFVGVSPSIVDLGELERGTTNVVKFYVVTVSENPLLVYLEPENGRLDFFNDHYNDAIFNYSEESTEGWVKFLNNPVELKSQKETLKTSYESIKGWREVDFLLEIPKNAEPGYHLIKIKPKPLETSVTKDMVGANIIAITSVNVIFKVPGEAKREGIILDSTIGEYRQDNLEIDTHFQNTGTTTITAMVTQKIYDRDKNFVTEISSPKQPVKPKEIKILNNYLPLTGLALGDYQVFTTVSYTTDSVYKNSTISVSSEALSVKPKAEEFPSWIFIIIIIIFAIVIYRWIK
jgi:hypothetical protein